MHHELIVRLQELAGHTRVRTDSESLALVASDAHETGELPCAVVVPDSAQALAACVAATTSQGYAVAPRGGGLSYTRGYVPESDKTVTFDLSGLNQIHDVSPEDMTITVGAGVTWKQISEVLKPLGLRLPFFGTFSGKGATVGGGLSHGALFFGSARYGSAAEIVLGLQVACADGRLLNTGQAALQVDSKPILRSFGPDLTGLFVHDGGTLGIKSKATLRLIQTPAAEDYLSFSFADMQTAGQALSALAREDLAEEVYVLDPVSTDNLDMSANDMMRSAKAVAAAAGGAAKAVKTLASMGASGKKVVPRGHFSLHLTAAGRNEAAVSADMTRARQVVESFGGSEIPATIPRVSRADLFANLNGIIGREGRRWAALNAKVAHSDAPLLMASMDKLFAAHQSQMLETGVTVTRLASALGNHCFSYEPVFHWRDRWQPIHRAVADPAHLKRQTEPEANPAARQLVDLLRKQTVEVFRSHGAASNQIGRTYPYYSALSKNSADLLLSLKQHLDPRGLMNPGVLELPTG